MGEALFQFAKTQTRRPLRDQPPVYFRYPKDRRYKGWVFREKLGGGTPWPARGIWCPYGRTGQVLWVREPYWVRDEPESQDEMHRGLAGHHGALFPGQRIPEASLMPPAGMPRSFSRSLLGVTGIRIQRLSEITEDECREEGFQEVDRFSRAWDKIYGGQSGISWQEDPWVWVVAFKMLSRSETAE